jgi:chloramphenicol 3-O-phosphotransferase
MTVPGDSERGTIVVLNGAPRSGKSTLVRAMQQSLDGIWINLGVDGFADAIPEGLRPGIGLRPGGERPDLEDAVVALFDALYASVAACSRSGLNVWSMSGTTTTTRIRWASWRRLPSSCARCRHTWSASAARWR